MLTTAGQTNKSKILFSVFSCVSWINLLPLITRKDTKKSLGNNFNFRQKITEFAVVDFYAVV